MYSIEVNFTRNSVISTVLFALLVATLMAFEEFYEGEMTATTAIEEIMAYLSILGILFLFVVAPFQRAINWLNIRLSWKGHFFKRLFSEGFIVIGLSVALGFLFGEFIHLYIDHVLPESVVVLRTTLFLLIVSSIIMALLELQQIHEEKEELLQLSQRLEKEKIESLYNSLKQQVNPHFLFNSLSVLSSLVHYDVKKAELFIQHFSDIYRYVLELNRQDLVTLEKELKFLDSWLFLQRIRFGENIHIHSRIEEGSKIWHLPPLSIQLVFENILKHNIVSREHPMAIHMEMKEQKLIVRNRLQSRPQSDSTRLGINNLKEKYRMLNIPEPVFEKSDKEFIVSLPLIENALPS